MQLRGGTLALLLVFGFVSAQPGHSQTLSVAAATGPVFLPGSGTSADWQGLLWLGVRKGNIGGRLEAMYTGVPGADLVALTANLVWTFRRGHKTEIEPYLVAGFGSYVKFSEDRFGFNGGAGAGRWVGPVRLFAEVRYHRVTRRFDEASNANSFLPVLLGITLGN